MKRRVEGEAEATPRRLIPMALGKASFSALIVVD